MTDATKPTPETAEGRYQITRDKAERALRSAGEWIEEHKKLAESVETVLAFIVDFVYTRVRELLAADTPPREPTTYVYLCGFKSDADGYAGGQEGEATWTPEYPVEIIDIIMWSYPATPFLITDITADEKTLLHGGGPIPAEVFGPAVQNRGIRTHEVPANTPIVIKFRNRTEDPTPHAFNVTMKVRSEFRA